MLPTARRALAVYVGARTMPITAPAAASRTAGISASGQYRSDALRVSRAGRAAGAAADGFGLSSVGELLAVNLFILFPRDGVDRTPWHPADRRVCDARGARR